MRYPGKSASRVRFLAGQVFKTGGDAREQYCYMREHKDFFLPVKWWPGGYRMPQAYSATNLDELVHCGLPVLQQMWQEYVTIPFSWKIGYAPFIVNCAQELALPERTVYGLNSLVFRLPEEPWVVNHGDSTMSNLVWYEDQWLWIDPAQRKYSPRTKSADVARMWQTLYLRYEDRFFTQVELEPDLLHCQFVLRQTGCSEEVVRIHLALFTVRLMRHLNPGLQAVYKKLLEEQLCVLS